MSRVLVLSPEPVRGRMAGMGIRALRIAEQLHRAGHDVLLGSPSPDPAFDAGVPSVDSGRAGFAEGNEFDVAIASGHAGGRLLGRFEGSVVADLYDPFLVENLAYESSLGRRVFDDDRRALFALVAKADFVLAATEEQRLFYLGLLLGRGRLSPEQLRLDPEGRDLVAVVPFGVDEEPAGEPSPHPAIGPGAHDVFFGGIYDWYEPGLLLDAWDRLLRAVPDARLLFSESPNPETTPQTRLQETRRRARSAGWLGRSVHVLPWVEHASRGSLYRSCRIAAVAHSLSLETDLSFRTRVLDFLWAGLPVVSVAGGPAARLVAETGAGLVVPSDPVPLAEGLAALLLDEDRRLRCAAAALKAAQAFRWSRVLEPLLTFAASPRRVRPPSFERASAFRRLVERLSGPGSP